ncbi:hypothetical protein MRB53_032435 [Persea americana]|uniref:Uncharacterized protein n=1 Tax=Persea americana TaxID=3435 RepID=A0ACC2KS78_PERAE|nr:hypothetical protein MRB53_032435 [Persea americana]
MMHYADGRAVVADQATQSNVLHAHKRCIEWIISQFFYPEHSSLKLPKGRSKSGYQSRANHGFVNDLDAKPGADNDNGNSSMSSLNHRSPSIALFSFTARFSHPKIVDNHNPQFMATSLSP